MDKINSKYILPYDIFNEAEENCTGFDGNMVRGNYHGIVILKIYEKTMVFIFNHGIIEQIVYYNENEPVKHVYYKTENEVFTLYPNRFSTTHYYNQKKLVKYRSYNHNYLTEITYYNNGNPEIFKSTYKDHSYNIGYKENGEVKYTWHEKNNKFDDFLTMYEAGTKVFQVFYIEDVETTIIKYNKNTKEYLITECFDNQSKTTKIYNLNYYVDSETEDSWELDIIKKSIRQFLYF